MNITLRYGRFGLPIEISNDLDVTVLHMNPQPPLGDEAAAIEQSFRSPIGAKPLDELARGRESACIVISDVTRPVPNEKILAPMLELLQDSGISKDKITILNATGLHRPNEGPELEEMIGAHVKENFRVVNHVARDKKSNSPIDDVPLGLSDETAKVAIDNAYLQSDLKITTGLIEPHFMAGYSGGRKLVCPGIASAETILQFHSPRMIGDANSRAGNLQENPVHAMSRAVAGIVGVDFICNVTLDEARHITGIFSGDLDQAHQSGIVHVDQQTKVPCEPAEIVITTVAGYPLDTTLYQAVKGMVGALPAIKEGGTMIVTASLSEGIGSHEFTEMCLSLNSVDQFMDRINHSPVEIDQWQLQKMMQVLRKCDVMIVSDGIEPETLKRCLLTPMPSINDALNAALKTHGMNAKINVIPEGPYVTPISPSGSNDGIDIVKN